MRRGTTEIKIVSIRGQDVSSIARAVMTIGQGSTKIHQDVSFDSEGNGQVVYTPDQTIQLQIGPVKEQVKILLKDGTVKATNIVSDSVTGDILNEEDLRE